MADFDGHDESVVLTFKSRKKKRSCTEREKEKIFRHSGEGMIPSISCNHIKGFCKAQDITPDDLVKCHADFYSKLDKVSQDAAIVALLDADNTKRVNDQRKKTRHMTIKYFLCSDGNKLQVCQSSFCSALWKNWDSFNTKEPGKKNCVKVAKKTDVLCVLEAVGVEERIKISYEALLCDATEDVAHSNSDVDSA
ncbi:uncharacterized protein LOC131927195 [Physella acuta]|uniref:uncharacterized protein LOC131927195 n=1 Tax=Physella acuta TaxID=109671 RepID=UPI0027DB033D|nr:uncharacterized protein LOC131927195 [Physella acuta]